MKRTLIATNIVTLIVLLAAGFGFFHYRAINKKNLEECQYPLNLFDFHYKSEPANYNVVMLGNSFMRAVSWDSLLNRTDVVSRGISGDRIRCICERVTYLKASPARICFIEGGINDLPGETPEKILQYYKQIVDSLQAQHKIPVINMVLYLSPKAPAKSPAKKDYEGINKTIQALNVNLKAFAISKGLDYIDLNPELSDNNKLVLNDKFTQDGVHPNQAAYRVWAVHIKDVLKKHAI